MSVTTDKEEKLLHLSQAREAYRKKYFDSVVKIQRFYRHTMHKRVFKSIMEEAGSLTKDRAKRVMDEI